MLINALGSIMLTSNRPVMKRLLRLERMPRWRVKGVEVFVRQCWIDKDGSENPRSLLERPTKSQTRTVGVINNVETAMGEFSELKRRCRECYVCTQIWSVRISNKQRIRRRRMWMRLVGPRLSMRMEMGNRNRIKYALKKWRTCEEYGIVTY